MLAHRSPPNHKRLSKESNMAARRLSKRRTTGFAVRHCPTPSRLALFYRRWKGRSLNARIPMAIDAMRGGYFGRTWFRLKWALLRGRSWE